MCGKVPPTCGDVLNAGTVRGSGYPYCQFGTGVPTMRKEFHYTGTYADGTAFSGSFKKAAPFMKYLWEVLEVDRPLTQNREVGAIVESYVVRGIKHVLRVCRTFIILTDVR